MRQNIYDNETFYKEYDNMRNDEKKLSANDLIEIPTIRSMLPDVKDMKVLELGCGYGENCAYLINKGAKSVLGTDISEHMIGIASDKYANLPCEFKVLAMEDISTLNEKYDLIISSLAVHYIEDYEKLLNDIKELLTDNGIFIYSQEHPVATGTILNNECHGEDSITLGDKNYYIVSDYNVNGKRIVDWNNCKVIKYHRNFSYLINTINKCGFNIEEILEPTPSDEILNLKPRYKNQFDRPFFLFLKLSKKK